jgi:flagellar hook-associated protein 3 FlgL
MRIATKYLFESVTGRLNKTTVEMAKANEVVSSGKRINRLSDDPVGLVSVLDLRSCLANIDQMERNIAMGRSWLTMAESSLSQAQDLLSQAQALCVEMGSSTAGSSARQTAAVKVDGFLQQILSLANTQVGGRYLFAGTQTDTAPFLYDEEGVPPTVTYQGNDTPFSVRIGRDIDVQVGRDGEDIFGDDAFDWGDSGAGHSNIFKTLIDLKTHLENDDAAGIQGTLDKLDNHLGTIRAMISNTGAKMVRLDAKDKIIQDLNLTYTERKSKIEDADIAEAIMELKGKELAYQAVLASASKIMSMSLVDYL